MHTIRLREPWQREWTEATNSAVDARPARYHRYFHRPSGLLDQQPITLVLQSCSRLVTSTAPLRHRRLVTSTAPLRHGSTPPLNVRSLLLNSQPLSIDVLLDNSTQAHLSVRIESALEPYNLLEVLCELPAQQSTIDNDPKTADLPPPLTDWAEVRIEIQD